MRVLFVVTEDWYFRSHRLALASRIAGAGNDVHVATRVGRHGPELRAAGLTVHDLPFERSLGRPHRDLGALRGIRRLVRATSPDLVHLVALKPILLGLAAVPRRVPTVAAFAGLGYLFSSADRRAAALRKLVTSVLRVEAAFADAWTIVQNTDDLHLLTGVRVIDPARTAVIAGAGVDTEAFRPSPQPSAEAPLVVLPARLLVDKGVREFVEAARVVRRELPSARFALVGASDPANPGCVPETEIARWRGEGVVEVWGHREDMPEVYARASVVCLPSWREGLPKALVEAAACARPLVSTDVPGCRDICRADETGALVPPQDAGALAAALLRMLGERDSRRRLGEGGRALVEQRFSVQVVAAQTLDLYRRAVGGTALPT